MGSNKKESIKSAVIAVNKRASHDYFLEQHFEAGISLQGWEVKALRAGRGSIVDGYVTIKKGEIFLIGANITPLDQACTHVICDPTRTRKLLLNRREIDKLIGSVERAGYTIVPLKLYWKKSFVKVEIALAKGKQDTGIDRQPLGGKVRDAHPFPGGILPSDILFSISRPRFYSYV